MTKTEIDTEAAYQLQAITSLDGRYRPTVADLASQVSEYALIRTRVEIEAAHLVGLSKLGINRPIKGNEQEFLSQLGPNLSIEKALEVKKIEDTTRHDVQAMISVFGSLLAGTSMEDLASKVHFPLTSEDVDNLAYRLLLKRAGEKVVLPTIADLTDDLCESAARYFVAPMQARTHGQPAVGTTYGKELVVFADRLYTQLQRISATPITGKFNGAVGNFNAHRRVAPSVDWIKYGEDLVSQWGFEYQLVSTQINPYEDIIEVFQGYDRACGVGIDLSQDLWRYISDGWLVQRPNKGESGSSTMVGKINPIFAERGEGGLEMAQVVFTGMGHKLGQSRLQRDLSTSIVIRNIGLALGFTTLGFRSVKEQVSRIYPNTVLMAEKIDEDYNPLAELAQLRLKQAGIPDAYNYMKDQTRGLKLSRRDWQRIVRTLPLSDSTKNELINLKPSDYTGDAGKIALTQSSKIASGVDDLRLTWR